MFYDWIDMWNDEDRYNNCACVKKLSSLNFNHNIE